MSIILFYFILITMLSSVDALRKAGVVALRKADVVALRKAGVVKTPKEKKYNNEVHICKNGTVGQLFSWYNTYALSLPDCAALIEHYSTYGCSQCKYQEQLSTCHCNKTCCSICIGMCVFCNKMRYIHSLSNTDAISVIIDLLRTFLLQVCALQPALSPNANEVLKKNFIVAMLNARLCLTELKMRRVNITL